MYRLAVFGNPVEHSLSPLIHGHFAKLTQTDLEYAKIRVEGDFKEEFMRFVEAGGRGCNVTVPCKTDAYRMADALSDRARQARAVNTLKVEGDRIMGDNTDGFGFMTDLERLEVPLRGARVLILGAGGAVRGIMGPLCDAAFGVDSISVMNRTLSRAEEIISAAREASASPPRLEALTYEDRQNVSDFGFDLVVNATSLPLKGEMPPVAEEILKGASFVYDLCYARDGETVFTAAARRAKVRSADGLGMLVAQAALSFELWFGKRPDIEECARFMREELRRRAT